jgi:hypothetical protein
MKDPLLAFLFGAALGAALFLAISIISGVTPNNMRQLKAEALKYGYARYVPDENANPKFEWIVPPEKKEEQK